MPLYTLDWEGEKENPFIQCCRETVTSRLYSGRGRVSIVFNVFIVQSSKKTEKREREGKKG